MTPHGQKLDRFLNEAIQQLGGDKSMPVVNSKASLSPLKEALMGVKRAADNAAQMIVEQAKQQAEEINANGELVVRKMQQDHQETMSLFSDMLGNERAEDEHLQDDKQGGQ